MLKKVCHVLKEVVVEHHMEDNFKLIYVYAGHGKNGAVFEEISAQFIKASQYKILKSPGLAQNLAKGDVIEINGKAEHPIVISRGGNFCIQMYFPRRIDLNKLSQDIKLKLNGTLDGANEDVYSFSIPSSNGMDKINHYFNKLKEEIQAEWYYANIYKNIDNSSDETLLNWWNE